jgi:hypothetical protein
MTTEIKNINDIDASADIVSVLKECQRVNVDILMEGGLNIEKWFEDVAVNNQLISQMLKDIGNK